MFGNQPYHNEFTRTRLMKNFFVLHKHNGVKIRSDYSSTGSSFLNTFDGEKNPQWRQQVREGRQAGTVMNGNEMLADRIPFMSAHESYFTKGLYEWPPFGTVGKYHEAYYFDSWVSMFDPIALSTTKADNEALANYVNKIREVQTSFQGGVFLGELGEAVSLIKNPARALRKGVDSFLGTAKKQSRRIRNLPKFRKREILADTWLEYSFGWKPLYNDLQEGLKTFAESNVVQTGLWKAVRGIGFDEGVYSELPIMFGTTWPTYEGRRIRKYRVTVRYIGQVDRALNAVYDAQNMGVDLHSLPLTAWEIVPWSFMIDYFTNLGDIISAASLARSSLRWTVRTVRREYRSELLGLYESGANVNTPQFYSYVTNSFLRNRPMVRKRVSRAPYTGSLVPQLEFSIPGANTKWLNIAALATGRKNLRSIYLT